FIGYFDWLRLGSVFLNSLTLLMNWLLFQLLIRIKAAFKPLTTRASF
ncbi:hypothetical protein SAMN05421863_11501, partial [Nitrosomonas communis]